MVSVNSGNSLIDTTQNNRAPLPEGEGCCRGFSMPGQRAQRAGDVDPGGEVGGVEDLAGGGEAGEIVVGVAVEVADHQRVQRAGDEVGDRDVAGWLSSSLLFHDAP